MLWKALIPGVLCLGILGQAEQVVGCRAPSLQPRRLNAKTTEKGELKIVSEAIFCWSVDCLGCVCLESDEPIPKHVMYSSDLTKTTYHNSLSRHGSQWALHHGHWFSPPFPPPLGWWVWFSGDRPSVCPHGAVEKENSQLPPLLWSACNRLSVPMEYWSLGDLMLLGVPTAQGNLCGDGASSPEEVFVSQLSFSFNFPLC